MRGKNLPPHFRIQCNWQWAKEMIRTVIDQNLVTGQSPEFDTWTTPSK